MTATRTIHDAITGEITVVNLTQAEIDEREQMLDDHATLLQTQADKAVARQAVLDKLGLTAAEAATLFG